MRILIAIAALALLAGCGSSLNQIGLTATDQQDAGITNVTLQCFDPKDQPDKVQEAIAKGTPCLIDNLKAVTGKEYQDVEVAVDLKAGTATFKAGNVSAFDGQKARAAAEQFFAQQESETAKAVGPIIVQGVVEGIKAGFGVP